MIAVDTSVLIAFIEPSCEPPNDPVTDVPVTRFRDRIEFLLKTLAESRTKIGVPTPVLAEYLVGVGANKQPYLRAFLSNAAFQALPFDQKSAIDLALFTEPVVKASDAKAKLRFDRQVIAIAKSHAVSALYTGDSNQGNFAKTVGVQAIFLWDLPLPPPENASLFSAEDLQQATPTSSPSEPQPPS